MRSTLTSDFLNSLDAEQAFIELKKCCGSTAWVEMMNDRRPFQNDEVVKNAARCCWNELDRAQRLAAFAAHPRIGDITSLQAKFSNTQRWAGDEQAGIANATETEIGELVRQNKVYFKKFGYIFIVCASGLTSSQMLKMLNDRLPNVADIEFGIASDEQLKITLLRLGKLTHNEKSDHNPCP